MTKTPVALFTYNRAEHTARVLNGLENCARFDDCSLYIYSDAAKTDEETEAVEATRQLLRAQASKLNATVIERKTNLGLARSVVDGVTDLCNRFGRVIVVEDDLVLNPGFLNYMLLALDRYADEPNIYQISGYMFPVSQRSDTDAFLLPLITTWGWATWQRAWQIFDWDASEARRSLKDPALRKRFDLNNSYPYSLMLEKQLNGLNNSWGILFWWQVFKAGGLALHPRRSLVWNGGFDNSGTNCASRAWSKDPSVEEVTDWMTAESLKFPLQVTTDHNAFENICAFLKKEQYPASLAGRIRRKLQIMLRS